jgi:hypothetical protein
MSNSIFKIPNTTSQVFSQNGKTFAERITAHITGVHMTRITHQHMHDKSIGQCSCDGMYGIRYASLGNRAILGIFDVFCHISMHTQCIGHVYLYSTDCVEAPMKYNFLRSEIDMPIEYYKLDAKFCRHQYKNGGVCIVVPESTDFKTIPTQHTCKEKNVEMCDIKLHLPKIKIVNITTYRSLLEIMTTSLGN